MGKVIICPEFVSDITGPFVFLAGPIQGAPDWQSEAIEILRKESSINIASPRRIQLSSSDFEEKDYYQQINWEHYCLAYARANGVILFWFPREKVHHPERAYAQTSRFELGREFEAHCMKLSRIIVGIEPGFSNERYLRYTISKYSPDIPLCNTLKETCERALEILN